MEEEIMQLPTGLQTFHHKLYIIEILSKIKHIRTNICSLM